MVKRADSVRRVLPELQKAQSSSSRAFANFGGRALYADPTDLAQISVGDR
jgi:hypothetical protein